MGGEDILVDELLPGVFDQRLHGADPECLLAGGCEIGFVADINRQGRDATIVTYRRMTMFALEAAKILAANDGINAEVIDLRTLKPMDIDTVAASVRKTG